VNRRAFLTLLGGAVALPFAAGAQQPAMPVIGFLNSGTREGFAHLLAAFHQSLKSSRFCRRPQRSDRISVGMKVSMTGYRR
jgi:hypothetical protein